MKILTVCGMGLGSSLILRMQVEKAAKALGLNPSVEVADITTARAMAANVDLIVTSTELADRLGEVKVPVITITNYMDRNEMIEKMRAAIASD